VREAECAMISGDGSWHGEEQRDRCANKGDRRVVKAICPAMRVMPLVIAPTMIAAIGPEPL